MGFHKIYSQHIAPIKLNPILNCWGFGWGTASFGYQLLGTNKRGTRKTTQTQEIREHKDKWNKELDIIANCLLPVQWEPWSSHRQSDNKELQLLTTLGFNEFENLDAPKF